MISKDLQITHATENCPVGEFGLGRIFAFDPRDRLHLAAPPPASRIDIRQKHWRTGEILNQGLQPHCVGFTGEQMLVSSPVRNKFYKTPAELYYECQDNDEFEGNSYDGTTVRALFKVLRAKGYIESWQNAFDADTAIRHVLAVGPVALGISWHDSMFYPVDFKGEKFIKTDKNSGAVGGHAILWTGCNLDKPCHCGAPGAARLTNSWSREFGDNGKVWICLKELALLIADFGECICSKELKFIPETK
jgi:C1A family cysteine protease